MAAAAAIGRAARIGRRSRNMRRPKVAKLARCPRLRAVVEAKLELRWSPQQIAGWLVTGVPRRRGDAGVARDDLPVAVRAVPRRAAQGTDPLSADEAQRPPPRRQAAQHRPEPHPGHGQHPRTARRGRRPRRARPLGRRPALRPRPRCRRHPRGAPQPVRDARRPARDPPADVVAAALAAKITELPVHLRRSLTWDQGREMAQHAASPSPAACPSTSATPAAPGSAAPTRTPTGCCANTSRASPGLGDRTQTELDDIADELNGRPRQTLGWMTPSQALDRAMLDPLSPAPLWSGDRDLSDASNARWPCGLARPVVVVLEEAPHDLPRCGDRHFVDELHCTGDLVGGEVLATVGDEFLQHGVPQM